MNRSIEMKNPARRAAAAAALWAIGTTIVVAAGLNDTGQSACSNGAGAAVPCGATAADGRYGRDAAAAAQKLAKTGAGAGGFDFTKIANDGSTLPAGAVLGTNPGDWACTRDNVTGVTWETKTDDSQNLRYRGHRYTWYSTAPDNGGNAGTAGSFASCNATLGISTPCDTAHYVAAINAAALCGYTNWRLPTMHELLSIVHYGASSPPLDLGYFQDPIYDPNSPYPGLWTGATAANDPSVAWNVRTDNGAPVTFFKAAQFNVYLVRSAP
jgi:hypothetical protein